MGWAVALSVLSAVSYAAAAVAQEQLAARGHRGTARWILSISLTGTGAALHVAALGFGTVGVVQALGTLTLLFALPVAALRGRARITAAAWRDCGLTVAGLAVLMVLATSPGPGSGLDADAARWTVLTAGSVLAVLVVAARHAPSRTARSLLLAAGAGTAFAAASLFTKDLLAGFSWCGAVVVALFATAGYVLGQFSYGGAGLAAPLAMVSVSNPLVAAAAGVLVLGEGFRYGYTGLALALLAAASATAGVTGLSRRTTPPRVPAVDVVAAPALPLPGVVTLAPVTAPATDPRPLAMAAASAAAPPIAPHSSPQRPPPRRRPALRRPRSHGPPPRRH